MIWVKALHVIFMVTWFAGLFYLPRLFVYHVDVQDEAGRRRFELMERKLFAIMTMGGVLTLVFGIWMLLDYAWAAYGMAGWLHVKMMAVVLLVAYHAYCLKLMRDFRQGRNVFGATFYRWFNEFPVLILFVAVIMVIVRPF